MGSELPARAEQFLHALARELQSLSSAERDAVLLELRSHLTDRITQSEATLDATLRALGDPADLAAEFDQGVGAGLAPVPQVFAVPWRPMRVSEVLLEVRATYLASRDGLMTVGLVLTAVLSAATFLWWSNLRLTGLSIEVGAVLGLQWAVVILAFCAGYRIVLSDMRRPWRIRRSTLRFAAAMIAVDSIAFAAIGTIELAIISVAFAAGGTYAFVVLGSLVWLSLVGIVVVCFQLRFQPWLVGLAIERSEVTIGESWRGTSGLMLNILRGWIVLVVPLYLLYRGVDSFVLEIAPLGLHTLGFSVLAGIISMGVVMTSILFNATIFRWAVGEPIPSARPFATEPPDSSSVEEARARLAKLLQSQQPEFHRS